MENSIYTVIIQKFVLPILTLSCMKMLLRLKFPHILHFFIVNILTVLLTTMIFSWPIGKEVLLLMQALNTLATPEEKLAALCKKYADLVIYFRFNIINMDSIINLD